MSNGACGPDHLFGNNWGWVDSQCRGAYTNNGVFPSITDDVILGTNTVGIDGFGSGSAHDMSIAAGGVLNHAGSMNLTGTFTNGGSVIFNGAGSHHSGTYLNNNSMVDPEFGRNRTGHDFTLINNGLFELSGSDWSNGSGSCAIVNNGELRKVQDTWFAPMNGFDVTNNGQINVNGGTLRFRPTQAHGCRFESTPSAEYTIDAAGT
ncbi:MAG TPA: hypothetical protein VNT99_07760, partial [Methylomirabilota bacterium]|nr:hypothetical protein [Methylomirabilota bacterium]